MDRQREVPLTALRPRTRRVLGHLLNEEKIIPAPNGKSRDWRGVLQSISLTRVEEEIASKTTDKLDTVLCLWTRGRELKRKPTIETLRIILGEIERHDVVEDTEILMGEMNHFPPKQI